MLELGSKVILNARAFDRISLYGYVCRYGLPVRWRFDCGGSWKLLYSRLIAMAEGMSNDDLQAIVDSYKRAQMERSQADALKHREGR